MGNIGWFLLIYFVVGWVLDIICTLTLVGIAAYKDQKNGNNSCLKGFTDETENIEEAANAIDDSGKGWLKVWLIGRLTWPYALPVGINHLWQAIKEAEVKKEES